jgi:hypothetical protein
MLIKSINTGSFLTSIKLLVIPHKNGMSCLSLKANRIKIGKSIQFFWNFSKGGKYLKHPVQQDTLYYSPFQRRFELLDGIRRATFKVVIIFEMRIEKQQILDGNCQTGSTNPISRLRPKKLPC